MIGSETAAHAWVADLPQVDALALERLERLCSLLAAENSIQNLVSAASLGEVWRRHIADSAQLLMHVPRETVGPWLDLGTGAGFPGLVTAILLPETPVAMVESRLRRADWLRRACEQLALENAEVLESRLERLADRSVRVISARAFAPLEKLLELSFRFSTASTLWLLPKGRSANNELEDLSGWDHKFHVEQSVTDAEAGIIVGTITGRKAKT